MKKSLMVLAVGGLLAGLSTAASAAVVCNRDGDCWRTKERYVYKPEWGLKVHKDNWHWKKHHDDRYRWRDSGPKRGYYSKGVWIEF